MGCYDSVRVRCPGCGEKVEFQSKAGDCSLASYRRDNVPPEIATDLDGAVKACRCGDLLRLHVQQPIPRVRMSVSMVNEDDPA